MVQIHDKGEGRYGSSWEREQSSCASVMLRLNYELCAEPGFITWAQGCAGEAELGSLHRAGLKGCTSSAQCCLQGL